MKKLISILALSALLTGCGGADLQEDYDREVEDVNRLFTMVGTVDIDFDPEAMTTEGMQVWTSKGDFRIELTFDIDGNLIDQNNTIAITDYTSQKYGIATQDCVAVLSEIDYKPRSFELDAIMATQGTQAWEDGNFEGYEDHITFHMPSLPQLDMLMPSISCDGGMSAVSPDPGPFMHMVLPFMQEPNGDVWDVEIGLDDPIAGSERFELSYYKGFSAQVDYVATEVLDWGS